MKPAEPTHWIQKSLADLSQWKLKELRRTCKVQGVSAQGTKDDLIDALEEDDIMTRDRRPKRNPNPNHRDFKTVSNGFKWIGL
jgi:hypothetical protein